MCAQPSQGRDPARRLAGLAASLLLLSALTFPVAAPVAADEGADNADGLASGDSPACMRCHWMETLAYRDHDTGAIVDLSIDSALYRHSVHHKLACGDCHDRGYRRYPHRTTRDDEGLDCVGCHRKRQDENAPDLERIAAEYRESVHEQAEPDLFSCYSCHAPHGFLPLAPEATVAEQIARHNGICLDCHADMRKDPPPGHAWLPHPQAHWQAVRCLDCHTKASDGAPSARPSHQVLAAADSARLCVECHSRDSTLLDQLYRHRQRETHEIKGWLAQAVTNEAYIVGMSRNARLDALSLAVIALMLAGIAVHAWLRVRLARRRTEARGDGR